MSEQYNDILKKSNKMLETTVEQTYIDIWGS